MRAQPAARTAPVRADRHGPDGHDFGQRDAARRRGFGRVRQVFLGTTLTAGSITSSTGDYSIGVAPPAAGASYLVRLVAPTGTAQTFPLVSMGFLPCPSGAAGFSAPLFPQGSAFMLFFTVQ